MGLFDLLQEADMRPEGLLGVIVGGHGKIDAMRYYRGDDARGCAGLRPRSGRRRAWRRRGAATWVILEAGGDPKGGGPARAPEFYTQWLPSRVCARGRAIIESYLIDTSGCGSRSKRKDESMAEAMRRQTR